MNIKSTFYNFIIGYFKDIDENLSQARIEVRKEDFIRKNFLNALGSAFVATVGLFLFFDKVGISLFFLLLVFPGSFIFLFVFYMNSPIARIQRIRKDIDAEIVSVLRFLILELKSGRSLYDSLQDISKNFDAVGLYVDEIINEIKLGNTMEHALNKAVDNMPAENLRIVIWEMLNHIQTGSNIINSLQTTMKNIVEQQKIEFKEFGKKLNVISLMYMILAIILPTIGFTITAVFLIFTGIEVKTGAVVVLWLFFTFIQLMFLTVTSTKRPAVEG